MRVLILFFAITLAFAAPAGTGPAPSQGGSLDEFVPSEEVPADTAISFPVDI